RYLRAADGKSLVDVRYAYDKSGAQLVRQFIHRAGRADFFQYDAGYRLRRADLAVRPKLDNESVREFPGFVTPPSVSGNWAAGAFAREMSFDDADLFTSMVTQNPDALSLSPLASQFGAPDALLFVSDVDGFARERDAVGNVTRTRLFVRVPGSSSPE